MSILPPSLRPWWITLRYGSRFTRAGRNLRRNLRAPMTEYVEVERPGGDA